MPKMLSQVWEAVGTVMPVIELCGRRSSAECIAAQVAASVCTLYWCTPIRAHDPCEMPSSARHGDSGGRLDVEPAQPFDLPLTCPTLCSRRSASWPMHSWLEAWSWGRDTRKIPLTGLH
jgi:hypothetical protein